MILNKFMRNKLTLLGVWNVPPLLAWPWFAEVAVKHFEDLTGIRIRAFTYVKDNLHYQYLFSSDLNKIRKLLDKKNSNQQKRYINYIYRDYYQQARKIRRLIQKIKKVNKFSNSQLISLIQQWSKISPLASFQIWLAVLLDVWYPKTNQAVTIKRIAAKARNHSAYLHDDLSKAIKKCLFEAAKKIGVSSQDIFFAFPEEILSALQANYKIRNLKLRRILCVTLNRNKQYSIYEGAKARQLFNQYIKPIKLLRIGSELRGSSAYPGKILGKVRIILRKNEFNTFKTGEILVTLQTMVDYIPLMKKAKAILTELGGLTSHAAIVSREFKKPCIVGISHLTSSIRTGDRIMMDADSGLIKRL